MSKFTRRVQILLDEPRYARLEQLAERRGESVAALIRQAIDQAFPRDWPSPDEAAAHVLAAEPMPVGDWVTVKEEILDGLYERGGR
jgi:predicted transcriptional regulator